VLLGTIVYFGFRASLKTLPIGIHAEFRGVYEFSRVAMADLMWRYNFLHENDSIILAGGVCGSARIG
jgi:hypothetical protein